MNQLPYKAIFVDPSYEAFYQDQLFDLANEALNRDDQLLPFVRLRESLQTPGVMVHTADFMRNGDHRRAQNEYYSLGLTSYRALQGDDRVILKACVLMEPPVVAGGLYKSLPRLATEFQNVYLHNIQGDGYSLNGVDVRKLKKFYWPIPYRQVLEQCWNATERLERIVVVNGNHNPLFSNGEMYSSRVMAMLELAKHDAIDLFGRGWKSWSRHSLWPSYLMNRRSLLQIYKGDCRSKYATLAHYRFCLCIENQLMAGYVTEKIFDCLYAGTIPLYLGAPDIAGLIPKEVFVDCRKFSSWTEMLDNLKQLSSSEVRRLREAGREFFVSPSAAKFHSSLENIFSGR
jgi:hypothetical protein